MSRQHGQAVGLVHARRRGSVVVLAAFLMIVMLGLVALSVDVGYMMVAKTQLQVAADSAALAAGTQMAGTRANLVQTAQTYAALHQASGTPVNLTSSDIEYGTWDSAARTFTPSSTASNAVRVTARRNASTGANRTFFGRILGKTTFDAQASAIALGNPRDICFVVDLSASMNRDTEPGWGNGSFSGSYASTRTSMMQTLYGDFNFGSYPGTTQSIGQPLGVSTFSALSSATGPLRNSSINGTYRIRSGDSQATRENKAYRWIIDQQIGVIMPNARPVANSGQGTNFNYWKTYVDAVISRNSRIGYQTYTQFMIENGRDQRPDGVNYTPLSTNSNDCRYHNESTAGGTFSFPPREQPTHACRRSIIAALQEIKTKNAGISDPTQKDWVSIVTFDKVTGTAVRHSLNSNYDTAMQACTGMQAAGQNQASTATETGLIGARNHIKAQSEGGLGRENTQKVVVLLTDGMANAYSSSSSEISSYRVSNPSSDFYGGSSQYAADAALMQADTMHGDRWQMYPVGIGLGTDYDFMDRMARMGNTDDDNGQSPRTSGDPTAYETELAAIFRQIIDNPQVRLVQ